MDQPFHHMQGNPKGLMTDMEGQRLGKPQKLLNFSAVSIVELQRPSCCREASLLLFSHAV
jgi:hypothetical protein